METILRIPRAIIDSILNAESDWIRYGLPALILTVFFSAMMLSKQAAEPEQRETQPPPSRLKVAEPTRPPFQPAFQQAEVPNGPLPDRPAFSPPPAPPMAASNSNGPPMANSAVSAEERQKQLAAEAVKWKWKDEGRRALCDAVRASLPAFKEGTLLKHTTIHQARADFRGDREMADKAVDQALIDYERNLWDESQCPGTPGQPRMSKGTINAVMKRIPGWFNSHQ